MKTECNLVKITPTIASEWLSNKWPEQRGIRPRHVERLASDMSLSKFFTGPDAILRICGKLANGQHRLSAVIKSGKAQTFIVLESSDENLYKVIDAGMKRKTSDSLIGLPQATQLPAIAKWVYGYDEGIVYASQSGIAPRGETAMGAVSAIDYCLEHKDILCESARFVKSHYDKSHLLPMSVAGAIYVICARKDESKEKAKAFIEQVYGGGPANTAATLRNRLILNQSSKSKLPTSYIFCITVKAMRAFLNDEKISTLKWGQDEELPLIP